MTGLLRCFTVSNSNLLHDLCFESYLTALAVNRTILKNYVNYYLNLHSLLYESRTATFECLIYFYYVIGISF